MRSRTDSPVLRVRNFDGEPIFDVDTLRYAKLLAVLIKKKVWFRWPKEQSSVPCPAPRVLDPVKRDTYDRC